jgi:hypothetical protein
VRVLEYPRPPLGLANKRFNIAKCPADTSTPGLEFDRGTGEGILCMTVRRAGGNMNANLTTLKPTSTPPDATVTTVFLKPTFGITVQSNTLSVSVKARPEAIRPTRPPARG